MPGKIASNEEWLKARKSLLAKEKELTRAAEKLSAQRRELPMQEITKNYTFTCPAGKQVSFSDLFDGRKQLIVYHFMFDPEADEGCVGCSLVGDHVPNLSHLNSRGITFAAVSRAPIEKINAFKKRMGWNFPWLSSFGNDFNYDFHVTLDEAVAPVEYNYTDKATLEEKGQNYFIKGEQPGYSVFYKDGDRVFHTYSTYARGGEAMISTYTLLDITPLGRQEDGPDGKFPWRHHDKYEN